MTDRRSRQRWLWFALPISLLLLAVLVGQRFGYGWLRRPVPSGQPVQIPDARLDSLIRASFRGTGPWTKQDLAPLERIGRPRLKQDPFPRADTVIDLTGIEHCSNLQALHAPEYEADDLTPLRNLSELRVLEIGCPGAGGGGDCDLAPLSQLTQLRSLKLTLGFTDDLSALSNLTELRVLSLRSSYPGNRFDLGALADLTKLEHLYLNLPNVSDVSPLRNMSQLRELALWAGPLRDIGSLAGLTKLEELQLGGNRIDDIAPLRGLVNLRVLFLEGNEIIDISPLADLTGLQWLSLGENRLSDITPLAGLVDLRCLDLDGNQIQDLSPLAGLPRLGDTAPLELDQRHFHRRQVRPLPGGGATHSHGIRGMLHLSGNRISDISPLVENLAIRARAGADRRADVIRMEANPLNDEAYDAHIPTLQERGVEVSFDPRP